MSCKIIFTLELKNHLWLMLNKYQRRERQTDRQRGRERERDREERQTDRQIEGQRERERETETETYLSDPNPAVAAPQRLTRKTVTISQRMVS